MHAMILIADGSDMTGQEQMSWEGTHGDVGWRGSSGPTTCSFGVKVQDSALDASSQHKARVEQTLGSHGGQPLLLHPDPSQYNPQASRDAVKTTYSEAAPPGHSAASLLLTVESRPASQ